ncbi:response regulator transcription factor [Agriterribacter humi]|jgi:DNA-binding NarL/FixJ family response regulator|uniref:response regulator transcription factor n=1 Tax=Agriterribacter humi TaxID=1104781 RepID=UPI0012640619|nr:response regulator transcription factor [Agriterribacter humi]
MAKIFLLADDHKIVRKGVKILLESIYPGAEIQEAFDGDSVLIKLQSASYDLLMLDIQMPGTDTTALVKYIRIHYPELSILVFSMSAESIYAPIMLKAGAQGFLSKDAPLDILKIAIDQVLNKRNYISDSLSYTLIDQSSLLKTDNPFKTLSPREREIADLLLAGKTMPEICIQLEIKKSTAATQKSKMFKKLNISNFFELKELKGNYDLV